MQNEQRKESPYGKMYPKASKYLGQIRKQRHLIATLKLRKENLQMLLTDKASHLSGMPGSDSPDLQREQTRVVEIDELEEEIAEARKRIKELKEEIGARIMLVSDPMAQRALIFRYLQCKSYRELGAALVYSPQQARRYLKKGLKEMEDMLPDED